MAWVYDSGNRKLHDFFRGHRFVLFICAANLEIHFAASEVAMSALGLRHSCAAKGIGLDRY